MSKKMPTASVDLIIMRGDDILLGRVSNKWEGEGEYIWGLPGREIKFRDNFEETVRKNLEEELGMELENFKVICVNNNFGFGNHYVVIGVLVSAKGEPKMLRPEDWKEWRWVSKDKIPDKLFPSAELTIKCFLENRMAVE